MNQHHHQMESDSDCGVSIINFTLVDFSVVPFFYSPFLDAIIPCAIHPPQPYYFTLFTSSGLWAVGCGVPSFSESRCKKLNFLVFDVLPHTLFKQIVHNKTDIDSNNLQLPKKNGRRIASWSEEEDDILREQIQLHETDNWAIIASKFKDKTTRQCRRRWFTYLNSNFKKGGWTPEEDMLLCKAQEKYGNQWTKIAKVVSGRTDNAVKNRFTTMCRKRAKSEAL